jgi:hypothetical protein
VNEDDYDSEGDDDEEKEELSDYSPEEHLKDFYQYNPNSSPKDN